MKWTKLSLTTTTQAVDLVVDLLNDLGIEGAQIEDNIPITEKEKKEMFIDILPELPRDDGAATVSFYLEPETNTEEVLYKVRKGLLELSSFVNVGNTIIKESETEDKDWINNWKEFFKPFRLDDNIIIKPTWEKLKDVKEKDIVIEIDPGTAFGTGSHETTKLCIHGLKKYINSNTKLLDVGCGSGILSIIGLKLGASEAVLTDIDKNAITATYENAKVNNISEEKFKVYTGDIIEDKELQDKVLYEQYDIVVANILANVIVPLSSEIGKHLKKDGIFITSGIINTKEREVREAILRNNFEILEIATMGEWVSIIAKK